ncbi:uncharacterized protein V6R79_021674 [Siganus canaliculatus]
MRTSFSRSRLQLKLRVWTVPSDGATGRSGREFPAGGSTVFQSQRRKQETENPLFNGEETEKTMEENAQNKAPEESEKLF